MQVVSAAGGIAFTALLGVTPLSLAVPAANGASLLTAAAGDWLLGDRMDLRRDFPDEASNDVQCYSKRRQPADRRCGRLAAGRSHGPQVRFECFNR